MPKHHYKESECVLTWGLVDPCSLRGQWPPGYGQGWGRVVSPVPYASVLNERNEGGNRRRDE